MSPQESPRAEAIESDDGAPLPGFGTLSREREPSRDLWLGIEPRLTKTTRQRRAQPSLWPYALAASVCLALLTGVLLRAQPASRPVAVERLAAASDPGSVEVAAASPYDNHPYGNRDGQSADSAALSPRTVRLLRSESLDNAPALVAARAEDSGLRKTVYSTGNGSNAHGQQAILRANLRLVSQAEREVRRALRADPDSTSLQSLLAVAEEKRAVLTSLLIHEQD